MVQEQYRFVVLMVYNKIQLELIYYLSYDLSMFPKVKKELMMKMVLKQKKSKFKFNSKEIYKRDQIKMLMYDLKNKKAESNPSKFNLLKRIFTYIK